MRFIQCWLLVIVLLWGVGCVSTAQIVASPLAIWDPSQSDAFDSATVGSGTLTIAPACVRLMMDNAKSVLLVWPEPTAWNSATQAIEFTGVQGEQIVLRNGERLMPGGSTAMGNPPFIVPPDPSCQADEIFIVSTVTLMKE